jgi:hypothetical protein
MMSMILLHQMASRHVLQRIPSLLLVAVRAITQLCLLGTILCRTVLLVTTCRLRQPQKSVHPASADAFDVYVPTLLKLVILVPWCIVLAAWSVGMIVLYCQVLCACGPTQSQQQGWWLYCKLLLHSSWRCSQVALPSRPATPPTTRSAFMLHPASIVLGIAPDAPEFCKTT